MVKHLIIHFRWLPYYNQSIGPELPPNGTFRQCWSEDLGQQRNIDLQDLWDNVRLHLLKGRKIIIFCEVIQQVRRWEKAFETGFADFLPFPPLGSKIQEYSQFNQE